VEEGLPERAAALGEHAMQRLRAIRSPYIKEVRGRGLLIGIELRPEAGGARRFCEALKERGMLVKETREHILRFAPPLVISPEDLDWALDQIQEVMEG
jgi:ornithine--oxo-acid transaminase